MDLTSNSHLLLSKGKSYDATALLTATANSEQI